MDNPNQSLPGQDISSLPEASSVLQGQSNSLSLPLPAFDSLNMAIQEQSMTSMPIVPATNSPQRPVENSEPLTMNYIGLEDLLEPGEIPSDIQPEPTQNMAEKTSEPEQKIQDQRLPNQNEICSQDVRLEEVSGRNEVREPAEVHDIPHSILPSGNQTPDFKPQSNVQALQSLGEVSNELQPGIKCEFKESNPKENFILLDSPPPSEEEPIASSSIPPPLMDQQPQAQRVQAIGKMNDPISKDHINGPIQNSSQNNPTIQAPIIQESLPNQDQPSEKPQEVVENPSLRDNQDDNCLINFSSESPELTDIHQIRKLLLKYLPPHLKQLTLTLDDSQLREMYLEIRSEEEKKTAANKELNSASGKKESIPISEPPQNDQLKKKGSPKDKKHSKHSVKFNLISEQSQPEQSKQREEASNEPHKAQKRNRKERKKVVTTVVQQVEYLDDSDAESSSKFVVLENGELKRKKGNQSIQSILTQLCSLVRSLDLSAINRKSK